MISLYLKIPENESVCPRGVGVKALNLGILVNKFELQSRYYAHFRTNTLGKGMNPPYPPIYGLNSITTVLIKTNGFGIK